MRIAQFRGLDGLKAKQLVREVSLTGSRVEKFRHVARETLSVSTSELVILAELLLRGPQTIGELRGNASRMHPLESIEVVKNILDGLAARTEEGTKESGETGPLVREIAPSPGSAQFVMCSCCAQTCTSSTSREDRSPTHRMPRLPRGIGTKRRILRGDWTASKGKSTNCEPGSIR